MLMRYENVVSSDSVIDYVMGDKAGEDETLVDVRVDNFRNRFEILTMSSDEDNGDDIPALCTESVWALPLAEHFDVPGRLVAANVNADGNYVTFISLGVESEDDGGGNGDDEQDDDGGPPAGGKALPLVVIRMTQSTPDKSAVDRAVDTLRSR